MNEQIIEEVDAIYKWLEGKLAATGQACRACGKCCNFDAYGHRLYLTVPELIYFKYHVGSELKPMPSGVCPYQVDNKCSVYPYRFAGCRIFDCVSDYNSQYEICEETVRRFKKLCESNKIEYRYMHLKDVLNNSSK